jgi:NitT/TauT family transport system ATP-binding protein
MIVLEKISKYFKDRQVLAGIDMTIEPNKVIAVLGPSGAGKTTLLRILAGSITPESGKMEFSGQKIAYVFQEPRLLPWRTALENAAFSLKCAGQLPRKEQLKLAESLLRKMGLGEFLNYYPAQLSGGMKQRVAIARAFALNPDLLLLDEPFSALDIALKNSLYQMLVELLEWQPTTAVMVTHDPKEAVRLADKVVILGGTPGRICLELDIAESRREREEMILEKYYRQITGSLTPTADVSGKKRMLHKQLQKVLVHG